MDGFERHMKEIDKKNALVRESHKKTFVHEINEQTKDAIKYDFRHGVSFRVSGFGNKKKPLSLATFIWRQQIRLEKKYPLFLKVTSKFRKIKNRIKNRKNKKITGGFAL